MKKVLFLFATMCAAQCFGIAASQAWVSNYVAQAISSSRAELEASATVTSTNGVTVFTAGNGKVRSARGQASRGSGLR